jgi:hypothetical protein
MKSFKIHEDKVLIDGILYSDSDSEQAIPIMGKWGKIISINVGGKQFFPQSGTFIDSTLVVTDDSTEGVEETGPTKKARKSK